MKSLKECRVLVTPTSYGSQDSSLKAELESQVGEVVYNTAGKPLDSARLQELLPGIDGMIAGLDEINSQALAAADDLKVIARYGVGCNNVDLEAARKKGIIVTNTPGANAISVAELAIALILDLLRPILAADRETKRGGWPRYKGFSLQGKTVGLLGTGAIGKETARRLAAFGCTILAYDLFPDQSFAQEVGATYLSLEEILPTADIISLHLPVTPDTVGLVDRAFLEKMKPGSWLVNTARGELVKDDDLLAALESGRLRGAALDAFSQEPPNKDHPLFSLEQVIATPHMGAHSDSATNQMGRIALEECLAVLAGKPPRYQVN